MLQRMPWGMVYPHVICLLSDTSKQKTKKEKKSVASSSFRVAGPLVSPIGQRAKENPSL